MDVDVTPYLPPDTISHGFDNVADSQTFSPTLMDGYLRAASQISRLAVGDRSASATSATYRISRSASQMRHVDGAPMGTRGGLSVIHTFPADGYYRFKLALHYEPLGGLVRPHDHELAEHPRAGGGVGQRRARADVRAEHAHERDRPEQRPRAHHAAHPHQGRPAAHLGGVRPAPRRADRRPADAAREHAVRRQHHASA